MRVSIAITLLSVIGTLCIEPTRTSLAQSAATASAISVPRGSRAIASEKEDQRQTHFISSRTFRKTVVHFRKQLSRNGYLHIEFPTYAYRQIVVARFVASGRSPTWNTVHVFRIKGKTFISIIR